VVDNFTLDGTTLALSSGDMTLDSASSINLNADNGNIVFQDGAVTTAMFQQTSSNFIIRSLVNDKDIIFQGEDNNTTIVALTLDMSAAGSASFSHDIQMVDNGLLRMGAGGDLILTSDGTNGSIFANEGDLTLDTAGDIILDADGGDVLFKDGGTHFGSIFTTSTPSAMYIQSLLSGQSLHLATVGGVALTIDSNLASTFAGTVTANAGVVVDNITIDGNEIDVSSGDLTLDVVGDIILDADGGDVRLSDAGTQFGKLSNSGTDLVIESLVSDRDMLFKGQDGSSTITALTLDMSAAGAATFNSHVTTGDILFISSTNSYLQESSSDLFIGSGGSATLKLAADGSLSTPTAGTSNVRFGVNAGNSIASGSTYNVLVGDEAGTALTTGDANVAIGFSALLTEDGHGFNTAVGHETLKTLNAGADAYNTAVGFRAGLSVTTGIRNTLIGGLAGDSLQDADFNVAIGSHSLTADTLGSKSIAIGHSALEAQNFTSATDTYNIAIGDNAGAAVQTGVQNTLMGGLAGDGLTTADGNTALGYNSLGSTCTGDYNQAFGVGALNANTSGAGNIGIGLNALFSNTGSSLNIAIGTGALDAFNVGSGNAYNVAIGDQAGGAVTTGTNNTLIGALAGDALTDSDYNVALGESALSSDTLGSRNTAIGRAALANQNFTSATTSYNTGVGYGAGSAVTTGTENTLIGGLAGDALTTGHYNVAVGFEALSTEDAHGRCTALGFRALKTLNAGTDSYNVAIGFDSGKEVTTGVENTFVGGLAGDATDDGAENVAVGSSALTSNCGNGNVAVGRMALRDCTGAFNTAIGHQSGIELEGGTNNTFLGKSAGDSLTTGSQNTIIGAGADAYAVDTVRTITIGYNTIGVQAGDGGVSDIATIGVSNGSDRIFNEFDTNATWTRVSDERYKEEIQDNNDCGLDFINDLRPVTFKWKPKSEIPNTFPDYDETATTRKKDKKMYGLIAQEVKASLDKFNITEFGGWETIDGEIQAIGQSMFVYPLIKAIQEQQALIESLTARIETLEG
jgi:hypothetical protein